MTVLANIRCTNHIYIFLRANGKNHKSLRCKVLSWHLFHQHMTERRLVQTKSCTDLLYIKKKKKERTDIQGSEKGKMKYLLMHGSKAVMEITIDEITGGITEIGKIYEPEHLPVGIGSKKGKVDRGALNQWWSGRAIPASRSGLREALEEAGIEDTKVLETKSLGLSLSDQYWINPQEKPVQWREINFFENEFSADMGNLLFGRKPEGKKIDFVSPDNTSDGWLRKKWVISEGRRYLVKGGSGPGYQEPFNEVMASRLMERIGIPHITYDLIWEDGYPYSVCEDFITSETELVSAWNLTRTQKKENHVSGYQHYLNCCKMLGIPGVQESLDQMLTVDYLIANTDRHYNNFGAVRNAQTLQWRGAAPIYDSGTSMWHDQATHLIQPKGEVSSKPFRSKHTEQIELVSTFEWMEFEKLKGIEEEYIELLRESPYIEEQRIHTLGYALRSRIDLLEEIVMEQQPKQFFGIEL